MTPARIMALRLPVIIATVVLMLSVAIYGLRWGLGTGAVPGKYVGPEPVALPESTAVPAAISAAVKWPAPVGQSRGPLWTFGLFTPPEIHFDRVQGSFEVIPPAVLPDITTTTPMEASAGMGLKLHAVQREPYPLQLVGYIGDESDLLGTFENAITGETLVLRQGARIDVPGLVLERLTLVRETTTLPDSMSIRETKIRAEVREVGSGRRLTLEQGAIAYGERLLAVISTTSDPAPRAYYEGASITDGATGYRIEKIRLAPPAVDVTKKGAVDADSNRHTLLPAPAPKPTR